MRHETDMLRQTRDHLRELVAAYEDSARLLAGLAPLAEQTEPRAVCPHVGHTAARCPWRTS